MAQNFKQMFRNKVTSKYPESVKKISVKYLALKKLWQQNDKL